MIRLVFFIDTIAYCSAGTPVKKIPVPPGNRFSYKQVIRPAGSRFPTL